MTGQTYEQVIEAKSEHRTFNGLDCKDIADHLFPFQRDLVRWALRKGRAAIFADTGLGKAQPTDEPVLTPSGWRPIGSLAVGDEVIAGDGSRTRVTGVFPQGVRDVARVKFSDGVEARCDWDHLWTVATDLDLSRGRPDRVMTTRDLAGSIRTPTGRFRWRVPVMPAVELRGNALPIDPYIMGVLLGDGGMTRANVEFTSADPEIAAEVGRRLPPDLHLSSAPTRSAATQYRIASKAGSAPGGRGGRNSCLDALREIGAWGRYSYEKRIPEPYLTGPVSERVDLLRGLMDTDGYAAKDGTVQFGSSSERLADDVASLVRSLGGVARKSSKIPTYTHNGEKRTGLLHFTLTLCMPTDIQPFHLARKVERAAPKTKYLPLRKIVAVEPDGSADCVCIAVEHLSHTYVTRDYIVTHNTSMQLEWARQVSAEGRVLLLAPLAVADQTVREGARFGVEVAYRREDCGDPITITNYEMAEHFDPDSFVGLVLDESSILKSYTGATRNLLIERFEATPYKLACTATPAPNDFTELGNHSEFLGALSRVEMLAEFFVHDGGSTQDWRLKGHAVQPFWEWVADWGAVVRTPAALGYDDAAYQLPPLQLVDHVLPVDHSDAHADGMLFIPDARTLNDQRRVRRSTMEQRCQIIADMVNGSSEPWLVWCELNDEGDLLEKLIGDAVQVRGADHPETKRDRLLGFTDGTHRVLVTKAKIAGFGMNWQHCARMAFVGPSHSYEMTYQAIRRCWRFGQRRNVEVHVVCAENERAILQNLRRKEAEADRLAEETQRLIGPAMRAAIGATERRWNPYDPQQRMEVPSWL